jgi:hypothetical protein
MLSPDSQPRHLLWVGQIMNVIKIARELQLVNHELCLGSIARLCHCQKLSGTVGDSHHKSNDVLLTGSQASVFLDLHQFLRE